MIFETEKRMNYTEHDTYGMYNAYKGATSGGPGPELMGADTLVGNDVSWLLGIVLACSRSASWMANLIMERAAGAVPGLLLRDTGKSRSASTPPSPCDARYTHFRHLNHTIGRTALSKINTRP
jgi:hypothetical protein